MIAALLSNRERLILQLANTVAVLLVLLYLYLISAAAPFWQTAPSLPPLFHQCKIHFHL